MKGTNPGKMLENLKQNEGIESGHDIGEPGTKRRDQSGHDVGEPGKKKEGIEYGHDTKEL